MTQDHAARWERAMMPNYGTPSLLLARGSGAHVWDAAGARYLDLLAGIAVNILGHAHPAVVAAVTQQVQTLGHTSNLYANEPALRLAERLQALAGGRQVLFLNSGTEANEVAYKIVRRHAHAAGLADGVTVAFDGSFHGRTIGALALTGQPRYHEGFAPFPPGIVHVPYNDPAALEEAFTRHRVAGVFLEYVQGEGGVTPATPEFARDVSKLCRSHGAVLVADEVQTGMGRTGRFFAHQHYHVTPDIVTLAKGIGGGLPLGACLVRPGLAGLMGPGTHGCTFGGNPVSCAAANAVLDVYETEKLEARATHLGLVLRDALRLHAPSSGVRGAGMLLGLPVPKPVAGDVVKRAAEAGLLVGQAGKGVVRLAPPLVIDEAEMLAAVPALAKCVEAATA